MQKLFPNNFLNLRILNLRRHCSYLTSRIMKISREITLQFDEMLDVKLHIFREIISDTWKNNFLIISNGQNSFAELFKYLIFFFHRLQIPFIFYSRILPKWKKAFGTATSFSLLRFFFFFHPLFARRKVRESKKIRE